MRNTIIAAVALAAVSTLTFTVPAVSQQAPTPKQQSAKIVDLSSPLATPPMPKADESVHKQFEHPELKKQQVPASVHGRTVILSAAARKPVMAVLDPIQSSQVNRCAFEKNEPLSLTGQRLSSSIDFYLLWFRPV